MENSTGKNEDTLPQAQPLQSPTVSVEIGQPPTTIEGFLAKEIGLSTTESNRAESQVSKQVLFLAGATLALLGSLVSADSNISTITSVVLILAVIFLGISITTGVIQFCIEYYFWRKNTKHLTDLRSEINAESDPTKKQGMFQLSVKQIDGKSSNHICFWAQISSFLVSAALLTAFIILKIV